MDVALGWNFQFFPTDEIYKKLKFCGFGPAW